MKDSTHLSRRLFLINAGATALIAPLVLRSGLRASEAPSNHIRIAVIGCGGRATRNVTRNFLPLEDIRIVAACDCFESRRLQFAGTVNAHHGMNVCTPFADFREVLARPDIDAVVISTPDHWHVPIAYAAIAAGKAVYVEKPLSIAMTWSQKLRALATKKQAVVQYGTQQRGDLKQFRRACELVRNGYIGEVKEVLAWCPAMGQDLPRASIPYGSTLPTDPPSGFDFDMWIGPAPLKPYTEDRCTAFGAYHIHDYSLGYVAGWGAHPLDIMQWGMDLDHTGPTHVNGTGKLPPPGSLWDTLELFDVTYRYANGLQVRLLGNLQAKEIVTKINPAFNAHGTLFLGSKGWINVNRDALYASDRTLQKHEVGEGEIQLPRTSSHARNFIDAIRTRAATISPLEAAIRGDTLSHLADIAIRTGREIRWDPVTETILSDADASRMLDRPCREAWNLMQS